MISAEMFCKLFIYERGLRGIDVTQTLALYFFELPYRQVFGGKGPNELQVRSSVWVNTELLNCNSNRLEVLEDDSVALWQFVRYWSGGTCCVAQFAMGNNKAMMSSPQKQCSELNFLPHSFSAAGALLVPGRRDLTFRIRYSSCSNSTSSINDPNRVGIHFH
jgi:hypothetical protein